MDKTPERTFYFLAGMPRSGSTLMSSLLQQNPRFTCSGASSPILGFMLSMEALVNTDPLYLGSPRPDEASSIVSSMMHLYHAKATTPVVFDKNRGWAKHAATIEHYGLAPKAKIVCTVRNLPEILASFISLIHRNPQHVNMVDGMLKAADVACTDDNRCRSLMHTDGVCGESAQYLLDGLTNTPENLLIVGYDDLVERPEATMRQVYTFLGEEYFAHTFTNVSSSEVQRDLEVYGLPDMHHVRPIVARTSLPPEQVLSPEILAECVDGPPSEVYTALKKLLVEGGAR